jgi:hypothetical protein
MVHKNYLDNLFMMYYFKIILTWKIPLIKQFPRRVIFYFKEFIMLCSKSHRYLREWEQLPDAQDDMQNDRHKCAGCAYLEGLKDALNGSPQAQSLS